MLIDNSTVSRTYRTSDRAAVVHVTTDRRLWLDADPRHTCGGNTAYLGMLPEGDKINRENVLAAVNQ